MSMEGNGLPGAPLATSQFNRPGLLRNLFVLNGFDGSSGRFFPDMAGDFLRVENVDYPCRISFNNADQDQAVPMLPGMLVRSQFSGLTLWHDNLVNTATQARAIVTVGRGGSISEADSFGGFVGQALPGTTVSATTTVSRRDFIAPYGARQMRLIGAATWGNPTTPFGAILIVSALNAAGANQSIGTINRNNVAYTFSTNRIYTGYIAPIQTGATRWSYPFDVTVDMPTWADRVICQVGLDAAAATNDFFDVVAVAR